MTIPSTAPVALIYVRISQDREGAGLGTTRQQEDCEKLAATLKMSVGEVYCDDDMSAFSGKRRKHYERMLHDIGSGRGDAVICWHTDRLYRRVADLLDYVKITNQRGIPTHGVTSGSVDLTTAAGRLMAIQFANMAEYESAHKAERISRKHQQSAKLGTWRGGSRPFGWGEDGVKSSDTNKINPVEAELIRQAYLDVIAGRALGAIIREWNDAGILSSSRYRNKATGELRPGKPWSYATLRQVLLRPRNYGASVYKDEIVGTGEWEPIIDEATWRTVRAILSAPDRRQSATNVGKHLLSGVALCGVCSDGTKMASGTSRGRDGKKFIVYKCRTGKHLARRALYTDRVVEQVLFDAMSSNNAEELLVMDDRPGKAELTARAMELRTRRNELKQLWKAGVMTAADVTEAHAEFSAELQKIEIQMEDPDRSRALRGLVADTPQEVEARWSRLDWSQKRAAINALMTVTVKPVPPSVRRTFLPEFIETQSRTSHEFIRRPLADFAA